MNELGRQHRTVPEAAAPDCCDMGALAAGAVSLAGQPPQTQLDRIPDPTAFATTDKDGIHHLHLFVDGMQCAACIRTIEDGLRGTDDVVSARVNISTGRLNVAWRGDVHRAGDLANKVQDLGYPVAPFDPETAGNSGADQNRRLLSALAVAGFAAANVMLLSVSVWAGAFSDMGPATRDLFHWISAAIALPAVAYAGRPFFTSAYAALKHGRMNMDVPISLAVLLAAGMSLQQTIAGREHAYFDASITLLFFLLIGRYLDYQARNRARETAAHLLGLNASSATVVGPDGTHQLVPAQDVAADQIVFVAAGAKVPVDGVVTDGNSLVDTSLVSGESKPIAATLGEKLFAGTMNLQNPLHMRATAAGNDTLLAEIIRLVEVAEEGRSKYVRMADRAASLYAPLVHILAAAAFLGWFGWVGAGLETSLMIAVAVLIITCPCALGLAVPVVQVVATGILLRRGILVKSGDAFERLATVDTVVFDKTGTLTMGQPDLIEDPSLERERLARVGALARHSTHPMSRAVQRAAPDVSASVEDVQEVPGLGLAGTVDGRAVRLGNAAWCGASEQSDVHKDELVLWVQEDDLPPVPMRFTDKLRSDVRETVTQLEDLGLRVELLSGDRPAVVEQIASAAGIGVWRGGCLPTEKADVIEAHRASGRLILMVGDGINDAPALTLGHASMSPASGAEISQSAADFVFQGETLLSVAKTVRVARQSHQIIKQNLALASLYNLIAVPIAVIGWVTPLVAAVAMSSSSILVTLNALRLKLGKES